jgi:methyltransferase (TIGR00027 family)
MTETSPQDLSGVAKTLLITLYIRAMESQRPDALIKDERAEALVRQLDQESLRKTTALTDDFSRVAVILKGREFDRFAQDFLARHPDAVVVHIGCGLDSRFERVAKRNSQAEWYDLDLPEVIELRRKLIGDEGERYHLLDCSVLEDAWREAVSAHSMRLHSPRPTLFLAETVFVYFTEAQVKSLVLVLRDDFPGAELVFDGWRPFEVWLSNRYFSVSNSPFAGLMRWGFWRGQEIKGWGNASPTGAGIRLLDEWGFFDQPEPRLASFRWMAPLFRLLKPMRIFHFQLGEAQG